MFRYCNRISFMDKAALVVQRDEFFLERVPICAVIFPKLCPFFMSEIISSDEANENDENTVDVYEIYETFEHYSTLTNIRAIDSNTD